MAGFPGRIYYEGNESGAADLINVAIKHAEKLHAWKQTQGIPNLVRAFDLGGGRYCVVADLNHMRALHVVSPVSFVPSYGIFESELIELDALGVIDVVSGFTNQQWIEQENIELPVPGTNDTETVTVDVLKSFTVTTPTANRYTAVERRRRLAIDRASEFSDGNTVLRWSQHRSQKPTHYTGAMRKLAQVILGIGKILRPTWEERWIIENKKSLLAIFKDEEQYKSAFGLYDDPKFTASLQTRLEFDYRFAKTHGIAFDQDNKPWLIEISVRGVHIMPVYMDPVSQFEAGLQRYKAVNPELEEFLDEFGGMPLMVTMPVGETFTSMKKAGEIRELVSSERMSEFYSKGAYCSEHGWAFNSKGSEAHNTCYTYNDNGLGVGYHYRIDLRVTGETLLEWTDETNAVAAGLNLSKLYELKKAQRLTELQARSVLRTLERDGAEAAKEEFDDIEVEPTINATGNLVSVRNGILYHPARFEFQPQIKYPEPLAGGLISHDFGRLEGSPRPTSVKCNTPMFVTFVDDELDVVYYYNDSNATPGDPGYSTRQECQYVGAWTAVGPTPSASVQGHFYSERKDFRELLSGLGSKTTYNGRKLYDYHYVETPAIFSQCVNVTKFRVFRISYDTISHTSEGLSVSVAMPINDRSCYYMAKKKYISGRTNTIGYTHEEAIGGRTDVYKLYNFVWHWVGCSDPEFITDEFPLRCIARKRGYRLNYGSCFFGDQDMDPVDIQYTVCDIPGCRADLASGNSCTAVTSTWTPTSVVGQAKFPNQNIPPPYSESVPIQPAEHNLEIWLFSNSGHGDVRAKNETAPTDDELTDNYQWWTSSPDEFGNIAQLYEVHSALGSQVMNYWDDMNTGELKHIGGPESMHASATACYTGVTE